MPDEILGVQSSTIGAIATPATTVVSPNTSDNSADGPPLVTPDALELGIMLEPKPVVTEGAPIEKPGPDAQSQADAIEAEYRSATTPEDAVVQFQAEQAEARQALSADASVDKAINSRIKAKAALSHLEAYFDDADAAKEAFGGMWKSRYDAIVNLTAAMEAALIFLEGSNGALLPRDYDEAVVAYNALAKLALEMKPITGKEASASQNLEQLESFMRKFARIGRLAFGPNGPQVVREDQMLYESIFEQVWHGHDIGLAITKTHIEARTGDNSGNATDLALFRQHDGRWRIRGYSHDMIIIPAEGVTIGRGMEIQGLESTQLAFERDKTVAPQHVRLEPSQAGFLRISNLSERGTHRHEVYWGGNQENSFVVAPRRTKVSPLARLFGK